MKRKIFIAIGAVIIVFVGWTIYGLFIAEPASPPASAEGSFQDLTMKVTYSRPYKKGRLIFGEESAGALVPYGKYWRLGANAATEITFSKKVQFHDQMVDAGTYRMYAVPGPKTWEVSLNSELGVFFGITEPDYSLDVAKITVPSLEWPDETEQFTINFTSDSTYAIMNFIWDRTMVQIPITPQ